MLPCDGQNSLTTTRPDTITAATTKPARIRFTAPHSGLTHHARAPNPCPTKAGTEAPTTPYRPHHRRPRPCSRPAAVADLIGAHPPKARYRTVTAASSRPTPRSADPEQTRRPRPCASSARPGTGMRSRLAPPPGRPHRRDTPTDGDARPCRRRPRRYRRGSTRHHQARTHPATSPAGQVGTAGARRSTHYRTDTALAQRR